MTPIIIYVNSTKDERKFFVGEPWPNNTTISKGLIKQPTNQMSVDNRGFVYFTFENGQATYRLQSYDPMSDTYTATLVTQTYEPMPKPEAA